MPPAHPLYNPSHNPSHHPVVRIALATALLVASFSMYAPVLAVLLQQRGHGVAVVGAFAMIGFSCIAVLIPVMPKIFARWGEVRVCRIGNGMQLVATIGYASFDELWVWCAFAVLGGSGSAAVWNATEALIARYSPPDRRGRITGLYQTLLGAAMAGGPFVPALFHIEATPTLIVASTVQAIGVLLLLRLPSLEGFKTPEPAHPAPSRLPASTGAMSTWAALKLVPSLALIAFAGGVFESGLGSVSAAHGATLGLTMAAAVSIVGALGVGSFLCQLPAGLMADHFLPARVFGSAGFLLFVSSAMMLASPHAAWLLWACAAVWGGVGGALYTLTMIRVAHQFSGQDTAAGSAAMITGYTLGGALGPLVSGAALQAFAAPGLALWLGSLSVLVMLLATRFGTPKIV